MPNFDTSLFPQPAASLRGLKGPGPQTNALPGVIAVLCGANPVACIVVGVAALAILAALYLACTNSNNQIANACIAAGNCPSGGSPPGSARRGMQLRRGSKVHSGR